MALPKLTALVFEAGALFCYLRGRRNIYNTVVVIKNVITQHIKTRLCFILHLTGAEYCSFSWFLTNSELECGKLCGFEMRSDLREPAPHPAP